MKPEAIASRIEELVKSVEAAHSEALEALYIDDLATFVLENYSDIVDYLRQLP